MILSISFQTYSENWTKLTPEQWTELRAAVPGLPEKVGDAGYRKYLVDDDGLRTCARLGLTVDLNVDTNCDTMLVKLQNRINALEMKASEEHQFSDRVQIAIPDMALMRVDEVTYRDDCCTDQIQDLLDDGWRILAVCPPNAQRRPDYILGRRKP